MSVVATCAIGLVAAANGSFQVGHLWAFDELTAKADLVVIAEPVRTSATGRRTDHPNLNPGVPVIELMTVFRVSAVLKADAGPSTSARSDVQVKHYQIDRDEWQRRNQPQPGQAPGGLVNAGTELHFSRERRPYLLFLARGADDVYEPLTGHTFPSQSAYALQEPVRPAGAAPVPLIGDNLVQQLGVFPPALSAAFRSDGTLVPSEARRGRVYAQLRALGHQALPALARGLGHENVRIRRNVALFLLIVAGGYHPSARPRLDIQAILPTLISSLQDADGRVRGLVAQAIGEIGPGAAAAIPDLIKLLADGDEQSRNSACIGLAGIGPPARSALAALRRALADTSADVRRFAQWAIETIEHPK